MRAIVNSEYESICSIEGAFGRWLIGLWGEYEGLETFSEQKEAFFYLLERLLRDGKAKFVKPDADVYHRYDTVTRQQILPPRTINDPETHWNAPVEEILDYLRQHWPQAATHKDDLELNAYFYRMPAIIWKGEDGTWYGG